MGGAEAWGTRKGSGIFSEPLKLISFSSHVMFEARKNVSVREQFSFFSSSETKFIDSWHESERLKKIFHIFFVYLELFEPEAAKLAPSSFFNLQELELGHWECSEGMLLES